MILLQNDIDENHYEMEELTNKRMDIQMEYRDKLRQLRDFQRQNFILQEKFQNQEEEYE